MEINGLPAHALLVHLVVVLLPLTALAAVLASVWPAAQRKLTFLVPLGAVVGAVAVPITTRAGHDLAARFGPSPLIENHERLGDMVLPWAVALAVTTVGQWLYLRSGGRMPWRAVIAVAVVVSAVGTTTIVALAGDAGARAVWGSG